MNFASLVATPAALCKHRLSACLFWVPILKKAIRTVDTIDLNAGVLVVPDREGNGGIVVTWFSDNRCEGKHKRAHPSLKVGESIEWHQVRLLLKAPGQAASARVTLPQSFNGPGRFIINWDNIELQAAEAPAGKAKQGMDFAEFYKKYLAPQ